MYRLLIIFIFILLFGVKVAYADSAQQDSSIKEVIEEELRQVAGLDNLKIINANVKIATGNLSLKNFIKKHSEGDFTITKLEIESSRNRFSSSVLIDQEIAIIQGRYIEFVEIPVLKRRMRKGELISRSDLNWKEINVNKLKTAIITDIRDIEGKELKRFISKGRQITKRDITNIRIVEKGNLVSVIYKTKYMSLKTLAKALEDGSEGEIIRVKNSDSGAIMRAMVLKNGNIMVNYNNMLRDKS